MRRSGQRGATTVEMTLVGIPLIFILISVFEISRGAWMYHTLAYAAKNGVRFAIAHGINCVQTTGNTPPGSDPNNCSTSIGAANGSVPSLASIVQQAAVGPDPSLTMVTFTAGNTGNTTSTSCYLATSASAPYGTLQACSSFTARWPPDNYNTVGTPIEIDIETPFYSALTMFWPGSKAVRFALVNFYASSKDYIQF
jgi:hypothetical protein